MSTSSIIILGRHDQVPDRRFTHPDHNQRDVAILGSDAASDVMPSGVEGVAQPIHQLTLIALGTPIFDNCDLEKVSETANRLKRWEFMVSAGPLPVPGGTGSPMNPLAIF